MAKKKRNMCAIEIFTHIFSLSPLYALPDFGRFEKNLINEFNGPGSLFIDVTSILVPQLYNLPILRLQKIWLLE